MISANSRCQLIVVTCILTFLCGQTIFGQTFQYSRGWTNGRKRSSLESFMVQNGNEEPEVFGICQMQRLKKIWDNRNLDREYLPCEMIENSDVEIVDGYKRKNDCKQNSILYSFPNRPN